MGIVDFIRKFNQEVKEIVLCWYCPDKYSCDVDDFTTNYEISVRDCIVGKSRKEFIENRSEVVK